MSKDPIPLMIADISSYARGLSSQLADADAAPSHLSLMNMLARAAGFRNYQHLRAAHTARGRVVGQVEETLDHKRVEKTLNQFDAEGRLVQWPAKRAVQELCLWAMWAVIPSGVVLHERDVNGHLNTAHHFDDAAILRRSLIGMKLLTRNDDGSDYVRQEQRPPAEAREVIRILSARRAAI